MERRFLFGQPVRGAKHLADGPRRLFVLGAYPSAIHVRWFGPDGDLLIQAVAVENEPEPFWTGNDQRDRIDTWLDAVSFRDDWGRVEPCGKLNGPSGEWVQTKLLDQLHVTRDDAWITDCLDTYFESDAAAKRLDSEKITSWVERLNIPTRNHFPHPTESQIVQMALGEHRERLTKEFAVARPERVVTLGNAAYRVFSEIADSSDCSIRKLTTESYGAPINVSVDGKWVEWIPLAHPAAPKIYQEAHKNWMASLSVKA
ncbi:MAG: hypothetical protein HGB26_03320 [Desulfobulbaceae bacterium]|nr:hypothetical protein [Desulfobulbaceae bacterium]